MGENTPISGELAILIPVLAETMKFATQALAQSTALCDIMISKGLATKAELEAAMKSTQELRGHLMKMLDEQIRKQS